MVHGILLGQSSVVTLPLGVGKTAVIDEWLVREGAVVAEQKVLLRYTCSGVKRDLQATSSGVMGKIGKKAGEQVKNAEVVCSINPCPHHESFHGICTTCGMEIGDSDDETDGARPPRREDGFGESMQAGAKKKSFGLFGGVVNSKLKRSKQGVAVQQQERVQELIASKRLALVLDLDHTLLHTSNAQNEKQRQVMLRVEGLSKDVKQIWCKGTGYFTKLRPHVRTFLDKLSHLYELYIYTAGDRDYAEVVASVLDEHKRYFPGRIISRDDYSDVAKEEKKLDKVFPVAEHWKMVLILDDNNETWDDPQEDGRNSVNNLIHADKYSFWPRHLGETHNPVVLGAKMHAHTEHGQHVLQASPPLTSPHHTQKQRHNVQVPPPPIPSAEPAPAQVAASFGASSAEDAALLGQEGEEGGKTKEEVGGEEEKDDSAEWVDQAEAAQDECNGGGSGDEAEEGGMLEEMMALLAADSTDDYLKTLTEVLTDLHTKFYAEIGRRPQGSKGHAANAKDACDVRELLARRQACRLNSKLIYVRLI
jgi:FCP1-like phosphatase family protein